MILQIKEVAKILKLKEKDVIDCATKILDLAKNFETRYPNFKNLKKFHKFSFNEKANKNKKEKLYL